MQKNHPEREFILINNMFKNLVVDDKKAWGWSE